FLRTHQSNGIYTVAFWRQQFHAWDGSCYRVRDEINPVLNAAIKAEFDRQHTEEMKRYRRKQAQALAQAAQTGQQPKKSDPPEVRKVTGALVANVRGALEGLCLVPSTIEQPAWRKADGLSVKWNPRDVLGCRNGLLYLPALIEGGDHF